MERKQTQILGYNIDLFNFEDAINYAKYLIDSDYSAQIVTINPEIINYGLNNEDFFNIVNSAELIIPEATGIKLALAINGINQSRIPGIEFAKVFLEVCAKNNIPVALIGAKKQILEKTVENLKEQLPNLNVVYSRDGYFQQDEETQIVEDLKQSGAKFILVALGAPKQEFFIDNCRKSIKNAVWIGVGGSFDVWSGVTQRAPIIYRKLGLEWLYRTLDDPKRINRIFPTLPIFMYRVIIEKLRPKKKVKNG